MYYLTMKELNKYKTITEVIEGYLKVAEASKILKLSERQIYRIKKRVEREGIKGIPHKSRGVKRARWLTQDIRDKASRLYNTKYQGFNITHVTEYLNTEEKIKISKESLRQILLNRGLHIRSKRHPKHLQWREPRAREGQMMQFDTSDHDWLVRQRRICLRHEGQRSQIIPDRWYRRCDICLSGGEICIV